MIIAAYELTREAHKRNTPSIKSYITLNSNFKLRFKDLLKGIQNRNKTINTAIDHSKIIQISPDQTYTIN